MLKSIVFDWDEKPEILAQKIKDIWLDYKVVHGTCKGFKGDGDSLRHFYDAVIEMLGDPANLAEDATLGNRDSQRSGQRWMEIRYDPDIPDAYRHSSNPQPLHTDGSYIPSFPDAALIYCESAASLGGATVFLDGSCLENILTERDPDLLNDLSNVSMIHARSGDMREAPVLEKSERGNRLHWNYYCVDKDASEDIQSLKERFHQFLLHEPAIKKNLIEVPLQPGDCVLWKDYETLHGRNGFDPKIRSERFLWKSAVQIECEV